MKRRELVAGAGSVVVFAAGWFVSRRGLPTGDDDRAPDDGEEAGSLDGPQEIRTIDGPGSEAGTVSVPGDGVTVLTFVSTGCGQCKAQVPRLAEARSRLREAEGEDPTFLTVTYEDPEVMPEDRLREWWADHGGEGYVGYDSTPSLAMAYGVVGYPVTLVIDDRDTVRWKNLGVSEPAELVGAIEPVLENVGDGDDENVGDGDDEDGSGDGGSDETEGGDAEGDDDGSDENADSDDGDGIADGENADGNDEDAVDGSPADGSEDGTDDS